MKVSETLPYNRYEIREWRQSLFDKDANQSTVLGFYCPRCRLNLASLQHGESCVCSYCDLHLQRWGNTLQCTGEVT